LPKHFRDKSGALMMNILRTIAGAAANTGRFIVRAFPCKGIQTDLRHNPMIAKRQAIGAKAFQQ
jgi:hypothetical protein